MGALLSFCHDPMARGLIPLLSHLLLPGRNPSLIVHNPSRMFLDSICWYFAKDFGICIWKGYTSLTFFSYSVSGFVCTSVLSDARCLGSR